MAKRSHKMRNENGNEFDLPCWDSRVPEYYLNIKGKRNGEERNFQLRAPCHHMAMDLKDEFFENREGTQSTFQLMRKMGWRDIQLLDIEKVE